jgi:hypothetical protein
VRFISKGNWAFCTGWLCTMTLSAVAMSCKPLALNEGETASLAKQQASSPLNKPTASPTPSASSEQIASDSKQSGASTSESKKLSIEQWFSKKNITTEEIRTVDALLDMIPTFGGPADDPIAAARWASGRLDSIALDGKKLTEIGPVLPLKRLVTITLHDNKLRQEQIDELLASLPNLRTLVIDAGLKCDREKYPKVTCLH